MEKQATTKEQERSERGERVGLRGGRGIHKQKKTISKEAKVSGSITTQIDSDTKRK